MIEGRRAIGGDGARRLHLGRGGEQRPDIDGQQRRDARVERGRKRARVALSRHREGSLRADGVASDGGERRAKIIERTIARQADFDGRQARNFRHSRDESAGGFARVDIKSQMSAIWIKGDVGRNGAGRVEALHVQRQRRAIRAEVRSAAKGEVHRRARDGFGQYEMIQRVGGDMHRHRQTRDHRPIAFGGRPGRGGRGLGAAQSLHLADGDAFYFRARAKQGEPRPVDCDAVNAQPDPLAVGERDVARDDRRGQRMLDGANGQRHVRRRRGARDHARQPDATGRALHEAAGDGEREQRQANDRGAPRGKASRALHQKASPMPMNTATRASPLRGLSGVATSSLTGPMPV